MGIKNYKEAITFIDIKTLVLGQEILCPDGLGRIKEITDRGIYVDTYIDNRCCCWASHNLLIKPLGMLFRIEES